MSAWITSKAHIDAMVHAAIALGGSYEPYGYIYNLKADGGHEKVELSPLTADRVGQMLTDTIRDGVSHRYPDDALDDLPGARPAWWLEPYKFERTRLLDDGELVALIGCYEYQACEHHSWLETFGWQFSEYLKHKLLKRMQDRWEAEHGDAKWGYEREDVETNSSTPEPRVITAPGHDDEPVIIMIVSHDDTAEPEPTPAEPAPVEPERSPQIAEFLRKISEAEESGKPQIRNNG